MTTSIAVAVFSIFGPIFGNFSGMVFDY